MKITQTDSRQEWCEEIYECPKCERGKVHKTVFDQRGLIISDDIFEVEE